MTWSVRDCRAVLNAGGTHTVLTNNSLNPTRPCVPTCGTLNYALSAMPAARIRARGLAQKGWSAR
jgi:hypothetical protein